MCMLTLQCFQQLSSLFGVTLLVGYQCWTLCLPNVVFKIWMKNNTQVYEFLWVFQSLMNNHKSPCLCMHMHNNVFQLLKSPSVCGWQCFWPKGMSSGSHTVASRFSVVVMMMCSFYQLSSLPMSCFVSVFWLLVISMCNVNFDSL